jgi:hypothetical protein
MCWAYQRTCYCWHHRQAHSSLPLCRTPHLGSGTSPVPRCPRSRIKENTWWQQKSLNFPAKVLPTTKSDTIPLKKKSDTTTHSPAMWQACLQWEPPLWRNPHQLLLCTADWTFCGHIYKWSQAYQSNQSTDICLARYVKNSRYLHIRVSFPYIWICMLWSERCADVLEISVPGSVIR